MNARDMLIRRRQMMAREVPIVDPAGTWIINQSVKFASPNQKSGMATDGSTIAIVTAASRSSFTITYSSDKCQTWATKTVSNPTNNGSIYGCLAYGNGVWVFATDYAFFYASSLSGTWTKVVNGYYNPTELCFVDGYFYFQAIADGNSTFLCSTDGVSWAVISQSGYSCALVGVGNGYAFKANYNQGIDAFSQGALSSTFSKPQQYGTVGCIYHFGDLYYIMQQHDDEGSAIKYFRSFASLGGGYSIATPPNHWMYPDSVGIAGNYCVAGGGTGYSWSLGNYGRLAYTVDGASWVDIPIGALATTSGSQILAVCYVSSGLWIACGCSGIAYLAG